METTVLRSNARQGLNNLMINPDQKLNFSFPLLMMIITYLSTKFLITYISPIQMLYSINVTTGYNSSFDTQ